MKKDLTRIAKQRSHGKYNLKWGTNQSFMRMVGFL